MDPEKPDFSGEWVLNRQASSLSPGADAVQSGTMQIDHREPMFRASEQVRGTEREQDNVWIFERR